MCHFVVVKVALQETQGETEINNQSINNLNFTTMPFWKKAYQKKQGVYYPQAIVQGKPVETETIAKDLAKISTVSNSDVQAVLGDIAGVMHTRMAQGKSVHIKGLGYNQAGTTVETTKVDGDWTDAVTQMNTALQSAGSEWRYELTGELPTLTMN